MHNLGKIGGILLLLMVLASCAHSKSTDTESLRSEIRAAISLASEADMFLNFVRNGQATGNYTAGHAKQLAELIQQSQTELREMASAPAHPAAVHACDSNLESLRREVLAIPISMYSPPALHDHEKKIMEIQRELSQASASL